MSNEPKEYTCFNCDHRVQEHTVHGCMNIKKMTYRFLDDVYCHCKKYVNPYFDIENKPSGAGGEK